MRVTVFSDLEFNESSAKYLGLNADGHLVVHHAQQDRAEIIFKKSKKTYHLSALERDSYIFFPGTMLRFSAATMSSWENIVALGLQGSYIHHVLQQGSYIHILLQSRTPFGIKSEELSSPNPQTISWDEMETRAVPQS